MENLLERARKIRLVTSDVDGVLTTGILFYGHRPGHTKAFNVKDGAAIKWLQRSDIPVAFISGLDSPATLHRAQDLSVGDCFVGHLAKAPVLERLCAKYGLEPSQVAHVGDDLADLPLMRRVGLACCPVDAVAAIQESAHWVVPVEGGHGVLRAVAELILQAQGHWDAILASYQG